MVKAFIFRINERGNTYANILGGRYSYHGNIVNRQLCIANAFEELIQEKTPGFHRRIRAFYDTYGYPLSRKITTPVIADIIYILMKPLEWAFLIFLNAFDLRPEQRIARQYIYYEPNKKDK